MGFSSRCTDLETGVQGTQDTDNEVRNDALHMLMMLLSALKPTNLLKHVHNTKTYIQPSPVKHIGYILLCSFGGVGGI